MVAFTYLFVRELPSAASVTTAPGDSTSSTQSPGTTREGATTTAPVVIDEAAQVYLEGLAGLQTQLSDLQTQLAGANSGWDATPRTVSFDQATDVFTGVATGASALVTQAQALIPPEPLTEAHSAVLTAIQGAADSANAALAGLRAPSPDTGQGRRDAVVAFDTAVQAFAAAVTAASTAASGG
jgi:hypothetical protein